MERTRNSTWLDAATDRKISRIAGRCMEEIGRMPGRGGGWRGRVIDAALAMVSEDAIVALLKSEAEKRNRAA